METERQMRDTMGGLMRRIGPAEAELFDPMTGTVFHFDFNAFAANLISSDMDGREYCDQIFGEREPDD